MECHTPGILCGDPPSRFGGWAKARFGGPSSVLGRGRIAQPATYMRRDPDRGRPSLGLRSRLDVVVSDHVGTGIGRLDQGDMSDLQRGAKRFACRVLIEECLHRRLR